MQNAPKQNLSCYLDNTRYRNRLICCVSLPRRTENRKSCHCWPSLGLTADARAAHARAEASQCAWAKAHGEAFGLVCAPSWHMEKSR